MVHDVIRGGNVTSIEEVRSVLGEVIDPCSAATGSKLDIVEMGLLKDIEIQDNHVGVSMRLTTPICHMVPYFIEEIERRVGALSGVDTVEVETDMGTEWSEEMMTAEAKQRRQSVLASHEARFVEESVAD